MPKALSVIDISAPVCCAPVAAGPISDDDALEVALRLQSTTAATVPNTIALMEILGIAMPAMANPFSRRCHPQLQRTPGAVEFRWLDHDHSCVSWLRKPRDNTSASRSSHERPAGRWQTSSRPITRAGD